MPFSLQQTAMRRTELPIHTNVFNKGNIALSLFERVQRLDIRRPVFYKHLLKS